MCQPVALTESSQLIKSFLYEVHQCPSECTRLDKKNVYFSNSCILCQKYRTDSNPLQDLESNPHRNRDDPVKDPKCGCEFDECILVLVRTGHGELQF